MYFSLQLNVYVIAVYDVMFMVTNLYLSAFILNIRKINRSYTLIHGISIKITCLFMVLKILIWVLLMILCVAKIRFIKVRNCQKI